MLDLHTLVFATLVCAVSFALAMFLLKRVVPDEEALAHWGLSSVLFVVALGLLSQRGQWPDALTWVLANTLLVAGASLSWKGNLLLAERLAWRWLVPTVAGVSGALNLALHLWHPSDVWRMGVVSVGMAVCLGGAGWGFWLVSNQRLKVLARVTSALFWVGSAVFLARLFWIQSTPISPVWTDNSSWRFLLPAVYGMLFINWSSIMVALVVGDKLVSRLRLALKKAEAADQAKANFLASVTHEWRTPLNAISGFAQLLTNDEHISTQARNSAALIHTAGSQLLDVVNDLIDLRALQEGNMEFKFQICHVQVLVDQAVDGLRPMAQQMGVTARVQGSATNPTVWVDPARLKQVLGNLVSNAIKFNRHPGEITVSWHDDGNAVVLSVTDQGPGIPPEWQSRVFKPFERLGAESSDIPGTGVGLAISQQLTQHMGGSIGFDTREGEGTTFWLRFPLALMVQGEVVLQTGVPAVTDTSQYTATQPFYHQPPAIPKGKQVLYVEDNPTNQKLVQAVFQKQMGLDVALASTAEHGIAMAVQNPPHLILMDLNLPGMDGYRALEVLRADPRTRDIPVMAVTAQSSPEDIDRGRVAGFDAYLTKPLKLGNLVSQAMLLLKR